MNEVILRHCRLSKAAGNYYEKKKAVSAVKCISRQNKGKVKEQSQQDLVSDMLELLAAFENHMGVDVETFLISQTA